jgi:hypothetical protein
MHVRCLRPVSAAAKVVTTGCYYSYCPGPRPEQAQKGRAYLFCWHRELASTFSRLSRFLSVSLFRGQKAWTRRLPHASLGQLQPQRSMADASIEEWVLDTIRTHFGTTGAKGGREIYVKKHGKVPPLHDKTVRNALQRLASKKLIVLRKHEGDSQSEQCWFPTKARPDVQETGASVSCASSSLTGAIASSSECAWLPSES